MRRGFLKLQIKWFGWFLKLFLTVRVSCHIWRCCSERSLVTDTAAKTTKINPTFTRGSEVCVASRTMWTLAQSGAFYRLIRRCGLAERDGTGPGVSSKYLSSWRRPKGSHLADIFSPSGSLRFQHFLSPVSLGKGWMSRTRLHMCVCMLCMCFPDHTPPCTLFLRIFRRGTLCDISIPTTSQGSRDLRPAPSQQCISLHPTPPPPFFLSPFLPSPLSILWAAALH